MSEKSTSRHGGLLGNLTVTMQEADDAYSSVAKEALENLASSGIYLAERPEPIESRFVHDDGTPKVPINISDLTDEEIGELHAIVITFFAYVAGQSAKADNEHKVAQEHCKLVESKVRLGKEGAQKDKDDKKLTDRRFVIANQILLRARCKVAYLNAVISKLEAEAKLISRNITLRGDMMKNVNRDASIRRRSRDAFGGASNDEQYGNPHPTSRPSSRPSRSTTSKKTRRAPPKRGRL